MTVDNECDRRSIRGVVSCCTAIDKLVVNVIGYVVSIQQLYGIESSRRGIVFSEDNGLTWHATSIQRFTWAASQGPDYIPAVPVPWVQGSGLTGAPPVAPYVVASWGGKHASVSIKPARF